MAQELEGSGLHIFVSLKHLSSTCHVSFFAAPDTDHKHKLSLTDFTHFSYLSDGLIFTNKPNDSQPIYTLRWPLFSTPTCLTDATDWNQIQPPVQLHSGVDRLAMWPVRSQTQKPQVPKSPARTERRPSMRCRRSKAPLSDERAVEEVAGIFVDVSRHERYSQRDWQAWERIQKQARDQWTSSFITLCQPTLLKKWCIPKLKRFCFRGLPYHPVHQKIF